MEFLGKNTAVGCHALLQGIFRGGEPKDQTHVSFIAGRFFTVLAIKEAFFFFKINFFFLSHTVYPL